MSDVSRALGFLASMPQGNTTVNKSELRQMLETTGGIMLARGSLYRLKSRYLGAGVYEVSLELNYKPQPKAATKPPAGFQIRFDGPPGPESGRFVEVETLDGKGIKVGEWVPDGNDWLLKIGAGHE